MSRTISAKCGTKSFRWGVRSWGGLGLFVLAGLLFARRLDRQVALTEQVRAESIGELEARVAERTAALRAEIAERESLEAARRRGQRMEAIGQLTGGVAHEFNNLLQVMLGNLDLLLSRTESTTRLTG